jgi:HAE1 family hydrophobic/amphiphilic exporter-1
VIFVYLILAAQFESFIDPLSIMLSLPLSIVGMAGMLRLTGDTINIMSLIGLIMLMGLVTKNAILLVDYTKVLRGRGMDRRTALITAGRTRLRPILMTTTAMIFGMLPLFFALGEGAEFRAPMARAVVGGLITSTLLTLIVVPVVYTLLDDVAAWLLGRRKRVAAVSTAAMSVALLVAVAQPASAQQYASSSAASPARSLALQVEQAASATAPSGVKVLTLEQALAIAAAQNRDVQKAIEYKNWVEGRYVQERAAALPQGTFTANFTRTYDDTTSKLFSGFMGGGSGSSGDTPDLGEIFGGKQDVSTANFGVTQVVFTWGQVGAAIRAAKLGYDYSDQQLRRFRQAVIKDVTTAFYNVLAARELVRIAEDNTAQRARRLDEVTKRREAGTATDFDVLAAQVELDNAKPAVIRSQNAVRAARAQLRFLLAEAQEVDAEGTLAAPVEPVPSFDALLATALQHRPELGEVHTQQGIYTELIKIAASGNKLRVDFAANWGKRHLALQTISSTGTAWNAGIFASVPIFDGWRTKGQVAQVKSTLATIDIDEMKLREGITLEVRTAVDSATEAVALLDALSGPVRQAQQLLFLAEKGYELGVKTRLEVQDAEQTVNVARANLAAAQRDYRVARVNLDWVAGVLDGGISPAAPVK